MKRNRTTLTIVAAICPWIASADTPSAQDILNPDGTPNPAYPSFYAWFDAGDGINGAGTPPDGSSVTLWLDNTGNGHDLVQTSVDPDGHPTFREDYANGFPSVVFDGNDYIWGNSSDEFGTIAGPKTFFVATRVIVAERGYVFDSSSSAGRNALFTGALANPDRWHVYSGEEPATVGPDVGLEVIQVHSVLFDSNAHEHFINGESVSTGTTLTHDMAGMILGSRYTVELFLHGDIAEVLVYDALLSQADRQAVEGYLLDKHPITEPARRMYVDGGDNFPPYWEPGNPPITDPTGEWRELHPQFSTPWMCTAWEDNGNGFLDVCDYLIFADESRWHVEWIGMTVVVEPADPSPPEDWVYLDYQLPPETWPPLGPYFQVHPSFGSEWNCTDFLDNGDGIVSPCDWLILDNADFWHVVDVAVDLELLREDLAGPPGPDFDNDGDVDTADLLYLLGAWGTPDGDVDGDGDTDTADLLALLGAWGDCP